ncbi:MAG: protein kinase [Elusimicrobia bacterium]|nr:protein kinase [Elusimicrobiota bacterium]
MPPRAALAAAAVLMVLSAAAADPPQGPSRVLPSVVDRSADNHATIRGLRVMAQSLPDSSAKQQVLPLLTRIDEGAARLPPSKRETFVSESLGELTILAGRLSPEAVPKEVLKQVQNGAAYLNNRANRWEESVRLSEQVLGIDPQNRDALLNRANAAYGLKNFQNSYDDADRAVKLDPNDPDGYTARALASYGLAEYLQAMEDARRALAMNPNDRTAHALMRLAEGRVPPTTVHDVRSRLEVEVQREYHGMVTQLNEVESRRQEPVASPSPPNVSRLLRGAADRIALKDYYGAVAAADKALAEDPNNAAAYYYRAAAYNLIGQYENAVANASHALSINPTETAARDARSFAYNHMGRFNDALADANHSLELNPRNPYAFANRGFAHERMGDLEAMLADLKKASELNPQFEPVYHDAAAAYGVEIKPLARRPEPPAAPVLTPRRKQFFSILLSSLAGGLLIAFGLLHIFGPRLARRSRAPSAINQSYDIGKPLGQGGMGVVYEAVDRALGRKVAIKMLLDEFQIDAGAKKLLLDEARTVAALHHPNIVDIHSIVADDRGLYLVFEFLSGRTVDQLVAAKGRLSLEEARALLKPVCAALDFAHRRGVVHRDLKPSNIMMTEQGIVKVMDFGISRRVKDTRQTLSGRRRGYEVTQTVAGTPYYMAPEQEDGIVRPEADIYSLGTCLYEMTTGRRPYPPPASRTQKTAADYIKPSALEPSLPRSFDVLIDGALHPDPERRIRTAGDFWALLEVVRPNDAGIAPS